MYLILLNPKIICCYECINPTLSNDNFFYGEKQHLFNDIRKGDFRRKRYSLVHDIRLKKTS